MRVIIQTSDVKLNDDIDAKIRRNLQLSLSRVESHIVKVVIKLTGANNSIEGNTHCRLTLALINRSDIVIEDTQMDLECVIDRVLHKASRKIDRLFLSHE